MNEQINDPEYEFDIMKAQKSMEEQLRRGPLSGIQQQPQVPQYISLAGSSAPRARIYAAMVAVMRGLEAIAKDSENRAQGFKFRGVDSVYNSLHPLLAKHGIFTVPRVLDVKTEERQRLAARQ